MKAKNSDSLLLRLLTYQKERFPLLLNGVVIGVFTFSAISYSRICSNRDGFVDLKDFGFGFLVTLSLFLLVRILDEFKDKEDDAKYRKYLPVPRGLIKLKTLKIIGFVAVVIQLSVILFFQLNMFYLYITAMAYLGLMTVEFFVSSWLKKHQMIYILSHMLIMPLVDMYASGIDWVIAGEAPSFGLVWFFIVSFFNGIVLEFGRKMKTADTEEEGVVSYTKLYGTTKAPIYWMLFLATTYGFTLTAAYYANFSTYAYFIFSGVFIISIIPAILFINKPTKGKAKTIEIASGFWTLLMYLLLGAIPMITQLLDK
jgi:4-hydroxybenzoate polyprenyltransferase